jgi:hypothetical protein
MQTVGEHDRSTIGEQKWDPELVRRQTVERLTGEFGGALAVETITRHVTEALQSFEGANIKDFVPIFVQRNAHERLRRLLQQGD